jgi:hypothetical protein
LRGKAGKFAVKPTLLRLKVGVFTSGGRLNSDVVNTLVFLRQLGAVMVIPHVVLEKFVPSYILEAAIM